VLQVSAKEVELLKSDQTLTECEIGLIMELNLSLVGIGPFGENVALNSCYGCSQGKEKVSAIAPFAFFILDHLEGS
jgi:hypothetical protein